MQILVIRDEKVGRSNLFNICRNSTTKISKKHSIGSREASPPKIGQKTAKSDDLKIQNCGGIILKMGIDGEPKMGVF